LVGIKARDNFFFAAMDEVGSGVDADVSSFTQTGMLYTNMKLKSVSCVTRDKTPYHG